MPKPGRALEAAAEGFQNEASGVHLGADMQHDIQHVEAGATQEMDGMNVPSEYADLHAQNDAELPAEKSEPRSLREIGKEKRAEAKNGALNLASRFGGFLKRTWNGMKSAAEALDNWGDKKIDQGKEFLANDWEQTKANAARRVDTVKKGATAAYEHMTNLDNSPVLKGLNSLDNWGDQKIEDAKQFMSNDWAQTKQDARDAANWGAQKVEQGKEFLANDWEQTKANAARRVDTAKKAGKAVLEGGVGMMDSAIGAMSQEGRAQIKGDIADKSEAFKAWTADKATKGKEFLAADWAQTKANAKERGVKAKDYVVERGQKGMEFVAGKALDLALGTVSRIESAANKFNSWRNERKDKKLQEAIQKAELEKYASIADLIKARKRAEQANKTLLMLRGKGYDISAYREAAQADSESAAA